MVGIDKVLEIIEQVYSEDGYETDKFTAKATFPTTVTMERYEGDGIEVTFSGDLPKVSVKRTFLRKEFELGFGLIGIIITKTDGLIKLDNFPDIPFKVK